MKLDRRVAWGLRVLMAALIIGLLYRVIGRESFSLALAQADLRWLPVLYATAALGIGVNASVLRYLLGCAGLRVGLRRVLLAKSLGSFYALILPGDFFAGAAKWADLSAATGDKAGVLSSLILTKISLAVPPLLVGSVALAMNNPLRNDSLTIAGATTAIVVVSVTSLLLYRPTGMRIIVLGRSVLQRLPRLLSEPAGKLLWSLTRFHSLPPRSYVIVLGLAFVVFGLGILVIHIATVAVGISVPVSVLFWVSLILFVTRLLPLTLGNLGVRESILVLAFGLYGVSAASAVLVGLLMFSSLVVIGMLGGVYQLAIASGWMRWRVPPEERPR